MSHNVLGFAYNVILTYCCIYVYIGDDVSAVSWDRCSLFGVLFMLVVVFFILFLLSFGWIRCAWLMSVVVFSILSLFSFRWMGWLFGPQETAHTSPQYTRRHNSR